MTQVMGVVNVTPDSFSDGGRWLDPAAAIDHGLALAAAGAHILDVGGESTRPGAERPDPEVELARVVPVVRGLARAGCTVSVDTMRAEVAVAAVDAGATIINDVSGGLADPAILAVAAANGLDYIAMHWRGHSRVMQQLTDYRDIAADVTAELALRRDAVLAAGIAPERLVLDPGFGFAKQWEDNWALFAGLSSVMALGHRVLVGVSRKAFLGALLAAGDGTPRPAPGRDVATAALSWAAADAGAWAVRVHDVRSTVDVLAVAGRLARARADANGPGSV